MAFSEPIRQQHKRDLAVEVLRTSGRLRIAARGYSMLPSLWPGDVLTIQAATIDRLAPHDVVLFCREGKFFIHRLLQRAQIDGQTSAIMRGDSMPHADHPVTSGEVLGKVVAIERNGVLLKRVPGCSLLTRSIGLTLGSWGQLRSVVLRLRQKHAEGDGLEIAPDGAISL
jgi:hypothetical protein